ncbi:MULTISPECIES: MoaD/ThiS family protein [Thermosphaera]|jgi:molybdopterin converting factor small subunit|uniref:ThiamineS protein n=2 Tax=Thermosphaera TaxID=54253 RepID=D5U188_THEAM|nr:MoaD/ThiS family protein [Thermosphaera aggregans]ADG90888.1 thiamineS protein [Thermosphaera aggregans DSM 11486]QOR93930.1 MoaD/ThiS family protein [Thermosphaera aggregans]
MKVNVRAYSLFSEIIRDGVVEINDYSTVKDLIEMLLGGLEYRGVTPIVFVNKEKAGLDRVLRDGDEVILTPPFSGG